MAKFLKTRQGVDKPQPSGPRISEGGAPLVGPQRDLTQGIPEPLPDSTWNQLPGVRKCRLCHWRRDCHPTSPLLQQGPPPSQDLSSPTPRRCWKHSGSPGSHPGILCAVPHCTGHKTGSQIPIESTQPGRNKPQNSFSTLPKFPFFC